MKRNHTESIRHARRQERRWVQARKGSFLLAGVQVQP